MFTILLQTATEASLSLFDQIMAYVPEFLAVAGTAFITWFFARKKNKAELQGIEIGNVDQAVEIWRKLASDLNTELKDVKNEYAQFKDEAEKLRKENMDLHTDVNKLRSENADLHESVKELMKKLDGKI